MKKSQHLKQIHKSNPMTMTTIVRIVRAICHSSQPSPRQRNNKNPPPPFFLASIVENDDKRMIRKDENDKVDGRIIVKWLFYYTL